MTKPKPVPPTPLDEIEDEGVRAVLQTLGDEATRLSGEIAFAEIAKKLVETQMSEIAREAGLRRIKSADWSAGPQPWRNENFRKERLLQQGWDVTCSHCQGALTVTTPLAAIEAATAVKTGEAWVVRRKAEKGEK